MNIAQLAKKEKVSVTTIANWVRKGMPAPKSKSGAYRFVLKDVRRWRKENLTPTASGNTLTDARRRKENALAGLRELELRKRQNELIERSAMNKEAFECARRTRDGFLNLPSRLSGILAAENNQDVVFRLLTEEIQEILTALTSRTVPS